MSYGTTTGTNRTITAFFDNRTDANVAIERLVGAGIQRNDISIVEGGSREGDATTRKAIKATKGWAFGNP